MARGALLFAAAVTIVAVPVSGMPAKLLEIIHPNRPNIEVVPGSFGSTDQARSVYLKESSVNVAKPTSVPASASPNR